MSQKRGRTSRPTGWVSWHGLAWASRHLGRYDITPAAKLVLIAMAAHIRDEHATCWPSLAMLERMTALSRRGVTLAIAALEQAELITREQRQSEEYGNLSTLYRLNLEAEPPGEENATPGETSALPPGKHSELPLGKISPPIEEDQDQKNSTRETAPSRIDSPSILTFPTVGPSKDWSLTAPLVAQFEEAFPGLDVVAECRKALIWCQTNPGKRKTASGMPRFLSSWITRAVNGGRKSQKPAVNGNGHRSLPALVADTPEQIDKRRRADETQQALWSQVLEVVRRVQAGPGLYDRSLKAVTEAGITIHDPRIVADALNGLAEERRLAGRLSHSRP